MILDPQSYILVHLNRYGVTAEALRATRSPDRVVRRRSRGLTRRIAFWHHGGAAHV